ncbi:S-formylglutathione hydrolase FrmB [Acetobacter oeni]|nr:S-formylglutathione hydrolase FrmB [Acetobacter oeni]
MTLTTRSEHLCSNGRLGFYSHQSEELGLVASFGAFIPAEASRENPVPVLHVLAGLTCNHETFLIK